MVLKAQVCSRLPKVHLLPSPRGLAGTSVSQKKEAAWALGGGGTGQQVPQEGREGEAWTAHGA